MRGEVVGRGNFVNSSNLSSLKEFSRLQTRIATFLPHRLSTKKCLFALRCLGGLRLSFMRRDVRGPVSAFEDLENVFSVFCFLSWKILNVYKRRGDYIMNPHVRLTQLQQAVLATFALAPGIDCRQRLSHGRRLLGRRHRM